jgi:hypothetical protein
MTLQQCLAMGLLASLPFTATAQQAANRPNPSDASAAVPDWAYASAFKGYRAAPGDQEPADKVWRTANDEVAKLGGHSGHIKSNGQVEASPKPAQAAPMDHGRHH